MSISWQIGSWEDYSVLDHVPELWFDWIFYFSLTVNSKFCPYPDVWPECAVADHWLLNNNSIYSWVLFPQSVMDVDIEKIRFKQIALTDTQQFTYQSRLELTVILAKRVLRLEISTMLGNISRNKRLTSFSPSPLCDRDSFSPIIRGADGLWLLDFFHFLIRY